MHHAAALRLGAHVALAQLAHRQFLPLPEFLLQEGERCLKRRVVVPLGELVVGALDIPQRVRRTDYAFTPLTTRPIRLSPTLSSIPCDRLAAITDASISPPRASSGARCRVLNCPAYVHLSGMDEATNARGLRRVAVRDRPGSYLYSAPEYPHCALH